jgi:hypothetical protein
VSALASATANLLLVDTAAVPSLDRVRAASPCTSASISIKYEWAHGIPSGFLSLLATGLKELVNVKIVEHQLYVMCIGLDINPPHPLSEAR